MIRLKDQERDRLAKQICAEILESEREKERLRERWVRLRAIHDCEESTSQVQLIEGMKPYVLPLSRTKADRIVGAVVDGITGIEPYVQVFDAGNLNSNLDDIEKDLMTLAQDAGDEEALRQGTEDAFLTNTGVWRVRPLVDERPYDAPQTDDGRKRVTRLDWEAIDPVDICCYPPYYGTFAAAKTVGHRWSELVYRVRQDMKSGMYETYDLKGGDDPLRGHRTEDDQAEDYAAQRPADEFVELWEVVTDLDLNEDGKMSKYLCVVALSEQKLLSIQPYPYSTPWYVEVRFERERKRIFPNSSIAQRLQGLQLAYSDAFTAMVQASYASIGPITILTGGGLMSKVQQLKPFMMIESPADVKVQSISANPQVGALPQSINKIEEVADSLSGINRNGAGQQLPSSTTATEVDALQQAQNDAKDQYTQVVAGSVERVFALFLEFYRKHFDELKRAYGDRLVADPEVVAKLRPTLKVNGRNGTASTSLVLQKLQLLLKMIGQMPNSDYDPTKIVDQIVQTLDLPFSLDRLKRDQDPLAAILQHQDVQKLLMQGEPLPRILQVLQNGQSNPSPNSTSPVGGPPIGGSPAGGLSPGAPPGQGVLPGQPGVGADPAGIGGPPGGAAPPMLGVGGGPPAPPVPGPMPGA